jgi:hypothetical protein
MSKRTLAMATMTPQHKNRRSTSKPCRWRVCQAHGSRCTGAEEKSCPQMSVFVRKCPYTQERTRKEGIALQGAILSLMRWLVLSGELECGGSLMVKRDRKSEARSRFISLCRPHDTRRASRSKCVRNCRRLAVNRARVLVPQPSFFTWRDILFRSDAFKRSLFISI